MISPSCVFNPIEEAESKETPIFVISFFAFNIIFPELEVIEDSFPKTVFVIL